MSHNYKYLLVENSGALRVLKLNNPSKKNALNRDAYVEITNALNLASTDDSVNIVAITGVGDMYTSGNDLSQTNDLNNYEEFCTKANAVVKDLILAFIEFPKILVAVVNGPCIGIGATTAALCDVVYCSQKAYFYTPFTKLGLCPEGCSTYTFPKILGTSKANEMLLFNVKLTAAEALQYKLVSEIFEESELKSKIWPRLTEYAQLPSESLHIAKKLIRRLDRHDLLKAMHFECDELYKRYFSEEFFKSNVEFINKKSKL